MKKAGDAAGSGLYKVARMLRPRQLPLARYIPRMSGPRSLGWNEPGACPCQSGTGAHPPPSAKMT